MQMAVEKIQFTAKVYFRGKSGEFSDDELNVV
jgi:hypothetical protein